MLGHSLAMAGCFGREARLGRFGGDVTGPFVCQAPGRALCRRRGWVIRLPGAWLRVYWALGRALWLGVWVLWLGLAWFGPLICSA